MTLEGVLEVVLGEEEVAEVVGVVEVVEEEVVVEADNSSCNKSIFKDNDTLTSRR